MEDVLEAEDKVTELIDTFCDGPTFTPSVKVRLNVCMAPWSTCLALHLLLIA